MIIREINCMNCKGKVKFDLVEFKKQIVECDKCKKKMSIRPFKNGRITAYNLEV